jgi:hypothetical protein
MEDSFLKLERIEMLQILAQITESKIKEYKGRLLIKKNNYDEAKPPIEFGTFDRAKLLLNNSRDPKFLICDWTIGIVKTKAEWADALVNYKDSKIPQQEAGDLYRFPDSKISIEFELTKIDIEALGQPITKLTLNDCSIIEIIGTPEGNTDLLFEGWSGNAKSYTVS